MNKQILEKELFHYTLSYDKEVQLLFYFINYNIEAALNIIKNNQVEEKKHTTHSNKIKNLIILVTVLSRSSIANGASSDEIVKYTKEAIIKIYSSSLNELYQLEIDIVKNFFNIYKKRIQSKNIIVYKIINYINTNLESKITVKQIAEKFNFTESYISHTFKKEKNISIKAFITKQKIERAKQLLLATDLSINKISSQLKFTNYSYFCKVFKKETGVTPKYYRSIHLY